MTIHIRRRRDLANAVIVEVSRDGRIFATWTCADDPRSIALAKERWRGE